MTARAASLALLGLLAHRSKILWYSVVQSIVMVGISVGQVYVVRALFEKGSTKRYRV